MSADLAMVPLLAVGEILLAGAFELLHGADVGPEGHRDTEDTSETHVLGTNTH